MHDAEPQHTQSNDGPACLRCAYPLGGVAAPIVCPECGAAYDRAILAQAAMWRAKLIGGRWRVNALWVLGGCLAATLAWVHLARDMNWQGRPAAILTLSLVLTLAIGLGLGALFARGGEEGSRRLSRLLWMRTAWVLFCPLLVGIAIGFVSWGVRLAWADTAASAMLLATLAAIIFPVAAAGVSLACWLECVVGWSRRLALPKDPLWAPTLLLAFGLLGMSWIGGVALALVEVRVN